MKRFLTDQSGATAVEYALMAGIMSVAVVSVAAAGGALDVIYDDVSQLIGALVGGDDGGDPAEGGGGP